MSNSLRTSVTAVFVASFCCIGSASDALAKVRVCQEQEQHYTQIKQSAGPLEINAALSAAADKGCIELARRLLDDGASLASRDRLGAMPLTHAAKSGQTEIVELFLGRDADINARDLDGGTALFAASEEDNPSAVQALIAHGADVNIPGRTGLTPIAAASFSGNEQIVRLLLDKDADPRKTDATGKAPILYAVARGFPKVVRLLIDHAIDVNARYGNDLTALMWAAGHEDAAGSNDVADVLALLIDHGAHIDDQDNRGRTALMIAASLGHEKAVDVLLASGANKALRDKAGKTAADLAANDALCKKLTVN
ncbi:MAG: ankyrin repeat domain-containing protein [Hyphomicrobium sp.]|nr:ankyrin repeat domain-containing protein [Hyphomicrobium sp.]